jgi:Tol biopolymer transport system component
MTLTWADVIYNPSLTRLVYPTYLQEIILWDTQEVKVINSFHSHPILHTEAPVWSPDGNQVVIRVLSSDDYGSALLLVSKDGDVKVLLKSEEYSITEDSDSLLMTGFSWSPDQNKIAFWLTEPYKEVIDNTETKLAVINLDNQAVNIYCIYGEDPFISPAPLWSPDGNSVALAVRYDFGDGNPYWTPTIILFDFEKAYLFPMEDDFSLAGWLE